MRSARLIIIIGTLIVGLCTEVWAASLLEKPVGLKFTCVPEKPSGAILEVHDDMWSPDGEKVERVGFSLTDGPRFRRALESCLRDYRAITRIELASNGGNVDAAFEIAQTIADYRFHTHVPAGSRCVSACTLAFLGGSRRTVHLQGSYEVHGFTIFGDGGEGYVEELMKIVEQLPQLDQQWVQKVWPDLEKEAPRVNAQLQQLQFHMRQLNEKAKELLHKHVGRAIYGRLQEIERDSALTSRRWMQMVQQRRVSSKLLDHIFSTTTSGVRPLTRQELEELAVITDDGQ